MDEQIFIDLYINFYAYIISVKIKGIDSMQLHVDWYS